MIMWSPFVQIYRKKYPWIQLAGHHGKYFFILWISLNNDSNLPGCCPLTQLVLYNRVDLFIRHPMCLFNYKL